MKYGSIDDKTCEWLRFHWFTLGDTLYTNKTPEFSSKERWSVSEKDGVCTLNRLTEYGATFRSEPIAEHDGSMEKNGRHFLSSFEKSICQTNYTKENNNA